MTSRSKGIHKGNENEKEEFEVLDVRDLGKEAETLFHSVKKYLSKGSNPKQLAIGGASGWYFTV